MATLAREIGRPQDMIPLVKQFLKLSPHLDYNERILFSQSYHESVLSLRQSLMNVQTFIDLADTDQKKTVVEDFFGKLKNELHAVCMEVITTTDDVLLPASENEIDRIFYNKMKGDYWRYDAEFQSDKLREEAVENAGLCYEAAVALASEHLSPVHAMRVGLILNYSVFLVDIKGERDRGRSIAEATLHEAEMSPAAAQEQDADICLKLLRDNCDLWKEEEEKMSSEKGE
jgi:14-3-3 protein epsilon